MLTSAPLLCFGFWSSRGGRESTADTPDYPGLERRVGHCRTPALGRMKGAGCQRTTAAPAQGEVFSLDIPFYRTRDSVIGHLRSVFSIAVRSDAYFCPAVMLRVLEQSRRTG